MNNIVYIDYETTLDTYIKTIDSSGGGFHGIRDEDGLRSVLEFMQNDIYYPTFEDKFIYLTFRICTGHYFNDGNKRVALTIGVRFLILNNKFWHGCSFMKSFEAIIYHVAEGAIDEQLYSRGVKFFLSNEEPSEAYKLELANAME